MEGCLLGDWQWGGVGFGRVKGGWIGIELGIGKEFSLRAVEALMVLSSKRSDAGFKGRNQHDERRGQHE